MSIDVRWLGHGCWSIRSADHTILLDPFLDASPTAPVKAAEAQADTILVSHGHFDHVADAASIAKRTGAMVYAIFEIAQWLGGQGVERTTGMNIGGGVATDFGQLKMTPALHSSQLPDGSYGGEPAGFLLTLQGRRLYFACDTGLFSDMAMIGKGGLDLAVLPIGDLFTMGPEDSIEAIRLLQPKRVAPAHYGTWPPIAQDAQAWAASVRERTDAEPIVLAPGESFSL